MKSQTRHAAGTKIPYLEGFIDPSSGELRDSCADDAPKDLHIEHWHWSGLYAWNIRMLKNFAKRHPEVTIELVDINASLDRSRENNITGFPTTRVFVRGEEVGDTQVINPNERLLEQMLGLAPTQD